MKRLRLLGLGMKLAVAGGRPAWTRLLLMAAGFAVGSSLLLVAMSIVPAIEARDDREMSLYGTSAADRDEDDIALVWWTTERYGDSAVQTLWIEAAGNAPVPRGLSRVPGPGEAYVSDAVLERGPVLSALVEGRLGARIVGRIGPDGVTDPSTEMMWIGLPDGIAPPPGQAARIRAFRGVEGDEEPLDLAALLSVMGIASAVLIPIWLFVATATRLSAATREQRLATVRLAGATERQLRLLSSTEAGLAAGIGTLLGIPLFHAIRPLLTEGVILDLEFYARDFAPPLVLAMLMLVGLPTFALTASSSAMRRLSVSPLGVARRVPRRHPGWRWTIALTTGVGLLAWMASRHDDLANWDGAGAGTLIVIALACTAFGLVGTAVWIAWLAARRLATRLPSVAGMLGMRRLESDPSSIGRVVGGVTLIVAMVGVLLGGLDAAERENFSGKPAPWVTRLEERDMILRATAMEQPRALSGLTAIPGVESVRFRERGKHGGTTRPPNVIVATDGDQTTVEAVRDALPWGTDAPTVAEMRASPGEQVYEAIRQSIVALALFLLAVNGASLLLAMVDWVMERRRALAVLSAVGVSASVLRRSILAQVALPLSAAVVFGVAGAATVTFLFYVAVELVVVIPWRTLTLLAIAAFVAGLGVTALTLPWVRVARRPELLRNE